ncbi:MAG: transcriptional repressor [Bacteroidaceae bacterium]|jgi:Fur family ferric uptake transcriptional regulator|nr:transcriptional repressor [Bacteroidaceae bacterium]MBR4594150.1 transcriptional repressor [Bacteroidaceae bacterium]
MTDRNEEMRQILADHLRLQNLRNTPERRAVLDAVLLTEGPFTPESLQEIMESRQNFRVCRATIYNGLGLLEDAGLVRKICLSGLVRYEKCWKNRYSIRLTCTSCGSVTDVNDDLVRRQIENMRKRRFTMAGWSLTVYGLCSKCLAALKRKQNRLNKKDKDKK